MPCCQSAGQPDNVQCFPNDSRHYNDAVCCAKMPVIFFNVTLWNEQGGDWESISSFNLTTVEMRTEVTGANLHDQDSKRFWVSSLVSVKDDASSIFCTIGFEKQLTSDILKVDYWLCELRFGDFALTKLALLPRTFA